MVVKKELSEEEKKIGEQYKKAFKDDLDKGRLIVDENGNIKLIGLVDEMKIGELKEKPLAECKKEFTDEDIQLQKTRLELAYTNIINVLKEFVELREEYYEVIALWIIGTYFHKEFMSYPYLFLNAMRGTAKTRTLKLISSLSNNGELVGSLTEAVFFRSSGIKTLCLDEFESVGKKHMKELRELLNAAYKKGIIVKRLKKVKNKFEEDHRLEEFEVYTPVAMANIWGMEEVLGDRCITLILEKSSDLSKTKLVENFDSHQTINNIKELFSLAKATNQCSLCSVVTKKNIYNEWNNYIKYKYITTLTTPHTQTTQTTLTTQEQELLDFFNKIDDSGLEGRNLELFLPLFVIAYSIREDLCDNIINVAKKMIKEKRIEESAESKDVMIISFIARQPETKEYIGVRDLTNQFRMYVNEDGDDDDNWINSRWMGRALKRLNLTIDKRRMGKGVEVTLNYKKAQDKLKQLFPNEE